MNDMSNNNPDTFVFFPTFLTQIEAVKNDKVQLALYRAVANYGLYGELPDFSDIDPLGTLDAIFIPMRYAIDEAKARRQQRRDNGKNGGAPKGNKNAAKDKTTENNQIQPKTISNNPNVNGNVDVNKNDIVKSKKSVNRFSPPTLEEIKDFAEREGLEFDIESMYDYYESNGWKVGGKATMKDWKAAARNWCRRESNFSKPQRQQNSYDVRRGNMEVTATSESEYKTTF